MSERPFAFSALIERTRFAWEISPSAKVKLPLRLAALTPRKVAPPLTDAVTCALWRASSIEVPPSKLTEAEKENARLTPT